LALEDGAMTLRAILTTALCLGLAQSATAAPANVSANAAILKQSSNTQALVDACRNLVPAMFVTTPYLTKATSSPNGEAALTAIKTFILTGHNAQARIRCAGAVGSASSVTMADPRTRSMTYTPYADRVNEAILAMFKDPDPAIRVGAADALWGVRSPAVGRALLHIAKTDPNTSVVAAAFQTMFWSMKADVSATHDNQAYDQAIARGIGSNNVDVVAAALTAYGALHGLAADKLLRGYALDKRAGVRLGAIAAYDALMAYNTSIANFLESRLSDPNVDVRDRVMLQLMRIGDLHALPAIDKLARTAPTAAERASAAAYAKTMRKDAVNNGLLSH